MNCLCFRGGRKQIVKEIETDPSLAMTIDVEACLIKVGSIQVPFTIKKARESLLSGRYDTLNELLEGDLEIKKVVDNLDYIS